MPSTKFRPRCHPYHKSLEREYRVLYVGDVMKILGIGKTRAYAIIRQLNNEIEAAGFHRPVGGRVSERYFRERFYLGEPDAPPSLSLAVSEKAKGLRGGRN